MLRGVTALLATNIRWCAGYSSSSYWLTGSLIDCSILSSMSQFDADDFADEDKMISHFASALEPFSSTYCIGLDSKNQGVRLEDMKTQWSL